VKKEKLQEVIKNFDKEEFTPFLIYLKKNNVKIKRLVMTEKYNIFELKKYCIIINDETEKIELEKKY